MAEGVRAEGSLPPGTVPFLITDIEGSRRLLDVTTSSRRSTTRPSTSCVGTG